MIDEGRLLSLAHLQYFIVTPKQTLEIPHRSTYVSIGKSLQARQPEFCFHPWLQLDWGCLVPHLGMLAGGQAHLIRSHAVSPAKEEARLNGEDYPDQVKVLGPFK